jgi:hypothetical protein
MPAPGLVNPQIQFFDDDGLVVANGFLYTYLAGTDTPVETYTDSDLAVPNDNPIELDASGRCVIYMDPALGAIKLILQDENEVQIWSQDDISPVTIVE